ncbi:UNVERIFIED_CONTAM: hypothetical protein GTU68_041749, partial [Idotea baltica]|nr:hypothetical protein [Idotea baltica]
WISPATCLWGLGYLSSQYGINNNVTTLLDNHDLYILPVLNPDGYNYTMAEDRLWRKNRMQYSSEDCFGTDLNRNYDDGHWGGTGSSNSSCSDVYHGPAPFSELETSAVRSKVLSIQDEQIVKSFFSIHSYGQLWLFAFGWTGDLPPESDELVN